MREIWAYTLPQIDAFVRLAVRSANLSLMRSTISQRVAANAEAKDFKKYLDELEQ